MASKAIEELKRLYQRAIAAKASNPVRALPDETKRVFSEAVADLDGLNALAEANRLSISSMLDGIPAAPPLQTTPETKDELAADPAYIQAKEYQARLEKDLARTDLHETVRAFKKLALKTSQDQLKTLEAVHLRNRELERVGPQHLFLAKYLPILSVAVYAMDEVLPLWGNDVTRRFIYQQAKAAFEAKKAEAKAAVTQGDMLSKLSTSLTLAVQLMVDVTGVLAKVLQYLTKLRDSDFSSDVDLTALLTLAPQIREMRNAQEQITVQLCRAHACLEMLSKPESE